MSKPIYLSYDGDGCGKKVGRAIMANDEAALHEISAKIDLGHEIVNHWVAEHGGKVISGGGDEGSFKLPEEVVHELEELRHDYHYATGITISVGVGNSLSEAGRSLLAAKFRGKDQIAFYGPDVEKDINTARKRVKKGKATQEEYKLAEAYLEKKEETMADKPKEKEEAQKAPVAEAAPAESSECQYCDETDGIDNDHCKYCHDADVEATEADCPYCVEADAATTEDCPYCAEDQAEESNCPYCAEQTAELQSPDSSNQQAAPGSPEETAQYAEMGMSPPGIPKPQVGDGMSPSGSTGEAPIAADIPAGSPATSDIAPEDAHSKEAMLAIAAQIQNETVDGKPDDKEIADQIDDTAIVGNEMQGNVSRPGSFDSNDPGDTGLDTQHADDNAEGNGSPNMGDVLQEGLNNNADDIQREQVREMVGQALMGFKASKQVLETAKQQAPELYNASIMMLKAMIEMARMLGMGGGQAAVQEIAGGDVAATGENEWDDPFPTHPDQGGQRKPGHAAGLEDAAGAPKAQGQ